MKKLLLVMLCLTLSGCNKIDQKSSKENVNLDEINHLYDSNTETLDSILDNEINENPFEYALTNFQNVEEIDYYVYSVGNEGFKKDEFSTIIDFNNFEILVFTKQNGLFSPMIFNWNEFTIEINDCTFYLGNVNTQSNCSNIKFENVQTEINGVLEMLLRIFYPNYYQTKENFTFENNILLIQKLNKYLISNVKLNFDFDNTEYKNLIKNTMQKYNKGNNN
ncbi:hypothetical protein [Anaerorhabdus sp.]|uniref:hypothetical protein n=1 Tax=Anaerorhabdus sp. TaxID=1872524 RepID=UPI002B1EC5BA|nr:hypothetical protein [Anaerorhabdus sp.]MEA4874308.1 hypothetical protein [Anaerorhabdus sp.]